MKYLCLAQKYSIKLLIVIHQELFVLEIHIKYINLIKLIGMKILIQQKLRLTIHYLKFFQRDIVKVIKIKH